MTGPALAEMADPYAAPPTAGFLSPDLTSVRIVGRIAGDAAALETRSQSIAPVLASLQRDFPSYQIHAIGMTLFADQIAEEINRDFDGSLAISLPATFLILLIAFGAVVAAGVPLVYAISALCGAFGLFGIFSQTVEPVSPFAAQFIVLVGLAVAVDYSLFMITRFRSERRAGRDKLEAIEVASATSGRAVLFSGMAVMVSLAGLFLLPDSLFQSIAIGTIAVIFVSMVGSLLFMPAMLSILGDGVNRGGIPLLGRLRSGGSGAPSRGFWAPIVRGVMGHPIAATVAATAALLSLASPVTRLHLGETDLSVFPDRVDGVQAVQALGDPLAAGNTPEAGCGRHQRRRSGHAGGDPEARARPSDRSQASADRPSSPPHRTVACVPLGRHVGHPERRCQLAGGPPGTVSDRAGDLRRPWRRQGLRRWATRP